MKFIVHCGLPKTGSTSIQRTLFENSEKFSSQGTVIPIFGKTTPGHRKLVVSKAASRTMMPRKLAAKSRDLDECRAQLVKDIQAAKANSSPIILSSESFADRGSFDSTLELRDLIGKSGGVIQALAYIRPPVLHLPSAIQQEAKNYTRNSNLKSKIFAHVQRASTAQNLFGAENLELRIFDRSTLAQADVVADFVAWVERKGVKVPTVTPAADANEAIGAPACAMLWKLQKAGGKSAMDSDREFIRARRLAIRYEADHPSAKLKIPADWEEIINQTVAERWNELVHRCSNDEGERNKFLIEQKPGIGGVDHLDKDGWVLSQFDPEYVDRVATYGEASEEDDVRETAALIRQKLL